VLLVFGFDVLSGFFDRFEVDRMPTFEAELPTIFLNFHPEKE
jgi:hypothetical protein